MAGRKKKSAGRMPLWLYVLIVVAIALVTYFRTSGEAEAGDPQPPAASAAAQQTPADETLTVRILDVGQGDSILLACGDETMLIDGCPVEEEQFLVSRLNRLDFLRTGERGFHLAVLEQICGHSPQHRLSLGAGSAELSGTKHRVTSSFFERLSLNY